VAPRSRNLAGRHCCSGLSCGFRRGGDSYASHAKRDAELASDENEPSLLRSRIVMLETPHLTLIPCSPEHLLALIDQPERFEELTGFPAMDGLHDFFVSGDVSPAWLAALRNSTGPDPWQYGFFVVHRENGSVIGSAGFKGEPDSAGIVEIAYGIVPSFQRRGYATEAAAALVDFAFGSGRVRLVRAHTLPEPNASTHVLLKCGFRHVGPIDDPDDGLVWRWERGP
jgi:ribosomal-protein-alanine N-acetyltransferase